MAQVWYDWSNELKFITKHPIPNFQRQPDKTFRSQQLHGFSDSSNTAYAGVVYLQVHYTDATVSTFIILATTKLTTYGRATSL